MRSLRTSTDFPSGGKYTRDARERSVEMRRSGPSGCFRNRTRIYSGHGAALRLLRAEGSGPLQCPSRRFPRACEQYPGESLLTYAQRMYALFCYPLILASLNTIKAGYVETANPLLSRSIVGMIRACRTISLPMQACM